MNIAGQPGRVICSADLTDWIDWAPTILVLADGTRVGWDQDEPDPATCDHRQYPEDRKFDGGRLPVLCSNCRVILRYEGQERTILYMDLPE